MELPAIWLASGTACTGPSGPETVGVLPPGSAALPPSAAWPTSAAQASPKADVQCSDSHGLWSVKPGRSVGLHQFPSRHGALRFLHARVYSTLSKPAHNDGHSHGALLWFMPLTISGKMLGSRKPLFADWSIPISPDDFGGGEGITLRDLIAQIVRAELSAYEQRREARRLDRVLSRTEIERGEQAGRIAPEGREVPAAPPMEDAIATALAAFEDGLYLVAIDGREILDLDARVFLGPDSRVTFIRLVFLAGA